MAMLASCAGYTAMAVPLLGLKEEATADLRFSGPATLPESTSWLEDPT